MCRPDVCILLTEIVVRIQIVDPGKPDLKAIMAGLCRCLPRNHCECGMIRTALHPKNELPRSKLRGINPPLACRYGPPVWRGKAEILHEYLRTAPTGHLGDAVAYNLFGLDQGIGHLAFLRLQKNKRLSPRRG